MKVLLSILIVLLMATSALAQPTATVSWAAPTVQNPVVIVGYRVHMGYASGDYHSSWDVGFSTSLTVSGLAYDTDYYFAVTTVANVPQGGSVVAVESAYSNEVFACAAPPPRCGDGICNGTESWKNCPADCRKPGKR